MKKVTSLREGLHVMMQCYMRQHFAGRYWLHELPRRTCIGERTYDEEIEHRHGWHGTVVLCFSCRTSTVCSPLNQAPVFDRRFLSVNRMHGAEVRSQNGYSNVFFGSDGDPTPRGVVGFVFLQVMSRAPRFEAGDGHKHGCLDALTIALGSHPEYEHAALASHQLTRQRGGWLRFRRCPSSCTSTMYP